MKKKLFRAGNICFLSLFVAAVPALALPSPPPPPPPVAALSNLSDGVVQSLIVSVGSIGWVNFNNAPQHVVPDEQTPPPTAPGDKDKKPAE